MIGDVAGDIFEIAGGIYFTWCCVWLIGQAFDNLDPRSEFVFSLLSFVCAVASA